MRAVYILAFALMALVWPRFVLRICLGLGVLIGAGLIVSFVLALFNLLPK